MSCMELTCSMQHLCCMSAPWNTKAGSQVGIAQYLQGRPAAVPPQHLPLASAPKALDILQKNWGISITRTGSSRLVPYRISMQCGVHGTAPPLSAGTLAISHSHNSRKLHNARSHPLVPTLAKNVCNIKLLPGIALQI